MDHRALAGTDERAPLRRKAWEALGKWVTSRVNRQRGVHVSNLFQICWKLVAVDDSGSKLRRPIFQLSERFAENFGVKQAGVAERGVPAPASGDDINFYQLAIQHSDGLTKDQAFSSVREMLIRLGEAASQGRELRLELGAGTLVVVDKEVSFDFSGGLGGGRASDVSDREKLSHLDPMLNGRRAGAAGEAGAALSMLGQSALDGGAPPSPTRSRLLPANAPRGGSDLGGGGARPSGLSAEEEAALFADVDALDPESVASASTRMRAADLEAPTRTKLGQALAVDPTTLAEASVEEIGEALGAKAAALEAQLAAQRRETDRIEAQLRRHGLGGGGGGGGGEGAASGLGASVVSGGGVRRGAGRRAVPSLTVASAAGGAACESGGAGAGSGLDSPHDTGALSIAGSGGAGSGRRAAAAATAAAAVAPPPRRAEGRTRAGAGVASLAAVGPPVLSVGFTSDGPGLSGAFVPAARPAVPTIHAAPPSDLQSTGARSRGSKVPVAPPLPPFRFAMPAPNDAANLAWKRHSAPNAGAVGRPAKPAGPGVGRSAGGLAPPFLAAPPVVAAASIAKTQGGAGKAWAG